MRTDRIVLTITHDAPEAPPAYLAESLAGVLASSVRVAGDPSVRVTAEVNPEDPPCAECGNDVSNHEWHYDGTHTYEPKVPA